jgi:hypothetical protein
MRKREKPILLPDQLAENCTKIFFSGLYLQEREMGRSPLVVKPEHLCRCITCNVALKGANERR